MFVKYFIPHETNDHKPHFLRPKNAATVALLVLTVQAIFLLADFVIFPRLNLSATILPNVLIDETNAAREEFKIGDLKVNSLLVAAAQAKANDMAQKGYFAHVSPDGTTPWYWFTNAGYDYEAAGENLAVNFIDSQDVVNAWMNSPSHRENILNGNYTEIGIATAKGMYEGHEAIFVVQEFGRPAPVPERVAANPPSIAAAPNPKPARAPKIQPAPIAVAAPPIQTANANQLATTSREVLGTANPAPAPLPQETAPRQSILAHALANPENAASALLAFLGLIVLVALFLKIFIKVRIQHPLLILDGTAIILLVLFLLSVNQHLATMGAAIF